MVFVFKGEKKKCKEKIKVKSKRPPAALLLVPRIDYHIIIQIYAEIDNVILRSTISVKHRKTSGRGQKSDLLYFMVLKHS